MGHSLLSLQRGIGADEIGQKMKTFGVQAETVSYRNFLSVHGFYYGNPHFRIQEE